VELRNTYEDSTHRHLGKRVRISHEQTNDEIIGLSHLAFSLGSKEAVVILTERFRKDGIKVVGEPRTTGYGYFESVILDLEGNRIEIVD